MGFHIKQNKDEIREPRQESRKATNAVGHRMVQEFQRNFEIPNREQTEKKIERRNSRPKADQPLAGKPIHTELALESAENLY